METATLSPLERRDQAPACSCCHRSSLASPQARATVATRRAVTQQRPDLPNTIQRCDQLSFGATQGTVEIKDLILDGLLDRPKLRIRNRSSGARERGTTGRHDWLRSAPALSDC